MKCINIQENLDALLDGEVEISKKREIENHLETCASCQKEFEYLQAFSQSLKRNLAVSAPPFLDAKVFKQFDDFHKEKASEKPRKEKIGWFGIPRFAFAAAFLLLALGMFSAFQIGKLSASEVVVAMPEVRENRNLEGKDLASKDEKTEVVKIVEVPVIKEKIVEVPVIKEKIVTKTVYINRDKKNEIRPNSPSKNNMALKNSVKDNGYFTQTSLKDFQPVSEFKLRINEEENKK